MMKADASGPLDPLEILRFFEESCISIESFDRLWGPQEGDSTVCHPALVRIYEQASRLMPWIESHTESDVLESILDDLRSRFPDSAPSLIAYIQGA